MLEHAGSPLPDVHAASVRPSTHRHVAIVDDNPADRHWMRAALKSLEDCRVTVHGDARDFLAMLRAGNAPDLTLVGYRMPVVDGLQVGAALSVAADAHGHASASWVLLTGLPDDEIDEQARRLGALDVLSKPMRADDLRVRVRRLLRRAEGHESLAAGSVAGGGISDEVLFEVLARVSRLRDDTTGSHVRRMALYAVEIARQLGQPSDYLDALRLAAPLHDIGKIGVPDRILNKRGALDPEEMSVMRRHAAYGAAVLRGSGSKVLEMARQIALSHHEKFDGSGYPQGLRGEAIPLEARIVSVADVFDALTTRRPYKEPWPVAVATDHIRRESGAHFDPQVIDAFVAVLPQIVRISEALADPADPAVADSAPTAVPFAARLPDPAAGLLAAPAAAPTVAPVAA
jgi:putative two-component system response regulator